MTDDTQTLVPPDVAAFVQQVRDRLDDLSVEDREELLDGLEADLTEQLADGAEGVLADPDAYTAELRTAAGLPDAARARWRPHRPRVPSASQTEAALDRARAWWFGVVDRHPLGRQTWIVLEALRPAWWVLRAWIAVTMLDHVTGTWEQVSLLPSLGVPGLGALILAVAVVGSVLIGLGRVWPGSGPRRSLLARVALIALNTVAIVLPLSFGISSPGYLGGVDSFAGYSDGYRDANREMESSGLRSDGRMVRNVFAYDAQGRPLSSVQLFDESGQPLDVAARQAETADGDERQVGCPWRNGSSPLYNVFPLAERLQRYGPCLWTEGTGPTGPVALPEAPLASVPPASLPDGVPAPAESQAVPDERPQRELRADPAP